MASLNPGTSSIIDEVTGPGMMNLKEMAMLYSTDAKVKGLQKRPARHLTIQEKLDAIQRIHQGESKASVARIIGVPESTLRGWFKNEDKLHAIASKTPPSHEPVVFDKQGGPSFGPKRFKLYGDATPRMADFDQSLMFWLGTQPYQYGAVGHLPPMETTKYAVDNSSWFWRWYKHYGFQPSNYHLEEPLSLVKTKSTLDTGLHNLNNEVGCPVEEAKENQGGGKEDDPPETAAEALKHGEKFLRWLESSSDHSVTAVQLLRFRYLLNNVENCAQRRANKLTPAGPRPKRK